MVTEDWPSLSLHTSNSAPNALTVPNHLRQPDLQDLLGRIGTHNSAHHKQPREQVAGIAMM